MKPRSGSVQKLGKDHYKIWYYVGDKRRSKTVHSSEAEAYALLAQLSNNGTATGMSQSDRGILKLSTYYHEQYHPWVAATKAARTVEGYESQWKLCEPLFGDEDMHTLKASTIEARIQTLPTPGQQQAVYKIMRQLFGRAYRRDIIEHNPMQKQIERKRMPYFMRDTYTAKELHQVIRAVHGYEFEAAILLCALAGLRRSEVCALQWSDIDIVEPPDGMLDGYIALVHVTKTWQRRRGTVGEQPTKTPKSVRTVAITGDGAYRIANLSAAMPPSYGVVSEPRPNPDTVTRSWKRFCETHGLRYVSLQGLRATYSTLLSQTGASDAAVSDSMGHTVLSTRYKHYLNRSEDARIALANQLTALLLHRDLLPDEANDAPNPGTDSTD